MSVISLSFIGEADLHEDILRKFVANDRFLKNDPYPKEFCITAFFDDFNGDGLEEALVALPINQYTDGYLWTPLWMSRPGVYEIGRPRVDVHGGDVLKEKFTDVRGHLSGFYLAFWERGVSCLCGRQFEVYEHAPDGTKTGKMTVGRADVLLSMTTRGRLVAKNLSNEIDDIAGNPGFEKLERVRWESYQGRDEMKRVSRGDTCRGYTIPEEQLRPLGGIAEPPEFDTFVQHYREEVKSRLNTTNDVAVLAVFHDADNDGDVDAYVSSSVERVEGDRYKWHLYLNGKDGFVRATHRISKRAREFDDAAFVEPEEVASRTAFHRVVRYGRLPMLVVLEKIGKRLHTRGFLKYVTEEERRTQPHVGSALYDKKKGEAYHEWCEDVNARLGYIHPLDLRELVDDFSFFRLERLPCREFPEGEAF